MMSLLLSPPRLQVAGPPSKMRENFVSELEETRPIHACENEMATMEDALPIYNHGDERRARVDDCL